MKTTLGRSFLVCTLFTTFAAVRAQDNLLPLGDGPNGIKGLTLIPLQGVKAELTPGADALKVTFAKEGEERRFVAFAAQREGIAFAPKALEASYSLTVKEADVSGIRLGLLLYEKGGGAWFKLGRPLAESATPTNMRFSVQSFREAAFSQDANGQLDWAEVNRLWFGLLVDGKVQADFELHRVMLTSRPYRPTKPLSVFRPDTNAWSPAADKAVEHKMAAAKDGPNGAPCIRYTFNFPGGRHMYATPSQAFPETEVSAYAGLRLTYKADLPKGINGLLFMVAEQGRAYYCATPAPPASDTWTECNVPFSAFKLASWTKDANGRLDLDLITRIIIGAHGTAQGKGGNGMICVADIQLLPPK